MNRRASSTSPTPQQRQGSPSPARNNSPSPNRKNTIHQTAPTLYQHGLAPRLGSPSTKHLIASTESGVDKVKLNSKGGVLVTQEEISTAFSLLDPEKTGVITLQTLKKRLGVLFPDMSAKEYRFLMNNKKEITIDDLKELLLENEVTNFDPAAEAFKVFDVDHTGVMNEDKLRSAFIAFGLGELSDEELEIMKRAADADGDNMITLNDFRDMLENNKKLNTTNPIAAVASGNK